MKVCLVSAPTANGFEDLGTAELPEVKSVHEHLPLGILSLAAVLQLHGITPEIVDLNDVFYAWLRNDLRSRKGMAFREFTAASLQAKSADLYGFSTICSSYPLTLLLCEDLKRRLPESVIVLGGPQASSVDVPTLESCPSVDLVVRGEAEETFPKLLQALAGNRNPQHIAGVSYRDGRRVARNRDAPVIEDLDSLPFPAFDLHPAVQTRTHLPLEFGRGCPYACTFCSTSAFFRRRFRFRSPTSLVAQMRSARERFNIHTFDLLHDSMTVNRNAVVEFCQEILKSGQSFSWGCSARTDQIDDDLIRLMARAGCYGIFFGVETGSSRIQKAIHKRLDLKAARRRVAFADRRKVETSVSFIIGFPEESKQDLAQTTDLLFDCLRSEYADPQVSILAPLAGSALYDKWRQTLLFDEVISELSFAGWQLNQDEHDFIANHPLVFPNFYSPQNPHFTRLYLDELAHFIGNGARRFRWLLLALSQNCEDSLSIFEHWRRFRERNTGKYEPVAGKRYYSGTLFTSHFMEFVRRTYLDAANGAGGSISCLLSVIEQLDSALTQGHTPQAKPVSVQALVKLASSTVPIQKEGALLVKVPGDYREIIKRLKKRQALHGIALRDSFVVFRQNSPRRSEVVEISSLAAKILSLCNGARSVREIAAEFEKNHSAWNGIPADQVCYYGLHALASQGLLATAQASEKQQSGNSHILPA